MPADASPARIRAAVRGDAARIASIYSESAAAHDSTMDTGPVDESDVIGWLERLSPVETILVVEERSDVLGWGIAKRYSDRPGYARAAETSVYLDRAHVGRGLGPMLQEELVAWCRRAGFHHLVAKIWADNAPSLAMHLRFGYETVGVQREIGFVGGAWRDVAILQRILDEA
jgi:phosphinothricin acetyltransferase